MTLFWYTALLFCHWSTSSISESEAEFTSASMELDVSGFLDSSLPVTLSIRSGENGFSGSVRYGHDSFSAPLEGEYDDEGNVVLYEFDQFSRVSAVITGKPSDLANSWNWYNADYSVRFPIVFFENSHVPNEVGFYYSKAGAQDIHVVQVRPPAKKISIDFHKKTELRWMDYECQNQQCFEVRPDMDLSNPLEFRLEEGIDGKLQLYPEYTYSKTGTLAYHNLSGAGFDYYYSADLPMTGSEPFDSWAKDEVMVQIDRWIQNLSDVDERDELPASRFKHRFRGDFFITLMDKTMVSGYLYFQGNLLSGVRTIPFMYDMQKERLFNIQDLFEKEFDYPFFLRTYLTKEKRQSMRKEPAVIREVLKNTKYTHTVLDYEGIVFFTDFNGLFGRRAIRVPYREVKGFLNYRSLEVFVKKNDL